MSRKELSSLRGVGARMFLAYALLFMQSALAGQSEKGKDESSQKTIAHQAGEKQTFAVKIQNEETKGETPEKVLAAGRNSGNPSRESIKVHGHWTLEVRNPDGQVATHREFGSSLIPNSGPSVLSSCLNGCTPSWSFAILQASQNTICGSLPLPNNPLVCRLPATASLGPNGTSFVLIGTITAAGAGSITSVESDEYSAPGGLLTGFTSTAITPVAVAAGQIVQLKVVISFS
jgi:hypothetical protein